MTKEERVRQRDGERVATSLDPSRVPATTCNNAIVIRNFRAKFALSIRNVCTEGRAHTHRRGANSIDFTVHELNSLNGWVSHGVRRG